MCDLVDWNDFFPHFPRVLDPQPCHVSHGRVENVEHELRCEADGEHEQCHWNDRNLFPGKRSGKALQLSASGPLKSACIARTKTIAVTSRPITAMAVKDAVMANEPLKIRNSPMKPFSPGKPNDENMATLIQPQRIGVRCINPPKSSRPRWPRRCSKRPTM